MRQKGTEQDVRHTDDQQDTGNHKKPATPETGGADRFGGTRTGAENVERPERSEAEKGQGNAS